MKLEGKVAIVTGAGRSIGKAIAALFAREGASVVIAEIDGDRAIEAAREIEAAGGEYLVRGGDFKVLEGDGMKPTRLVLIRFPSEEHFKTWYHSEEYQKVRAIRLPVSTMTFIGVAGADA